MADEATTITTERREASQARVPTPLEGHAIIFTRYQEERAVVIHPADFHRLAELDEALSRLPPIVESDLAALAHEIEDVPAGAVEDPDRLAELLGLAAE